MTPLVKAICLALPQHSQKDIEGVLPQVQKGKSVTIGEAVAGVQAALQSVKAQPPKTVTKKEERRQDYIARIKSILERQPEPCEVSRIVYTYLYEDPK